MLVGYFKDEMVEVGADSVVEAAKIYADENHQIDEESDMNFELFVEDDNGIMRKIKMYTEYDPRYEVESSTVEK